MFELKRLAKDDVPRALERAERYRLLNEPREAESICLDVLEVEPAHQRTLVVLILALTDRFPGDLGPFDEALALLPRLDSEYDRAYYRGIVYERRAKAMYARGGPGCGRIAHEWLTKAMAAYENAQELSADHMHAVLRWNTCARTIMRHPDIQPEPEDTFQPFLE